MASWGQLQAGRPHAKYSSTAMAILPDAIRHGGPFRTSVVSQASFGGGESTASEASGSPEGVDMAAVRDQRKESTTDAKAMFNKLSKGEVLAIVQQFPESSQGRWIFFINKHFSTICWDGITARASPTVLLDFLQCQKQELEPGPLPIQDAYKTCLAALPAANNFAQYWSDWQDGSAMDPVFNCLRPSSAKSTSPALMHPAFGIFLERVASTSLDTATIRVLLTLIKEMSESYQDTTGKTARGVTCKVFGAQHTGKARGQERTRAQRFRDQLLELLKPHVKAWPSAVTLEPSSVDEDAEAETDGSLRVKDSSGRIVAQLLIIEAKEGVGGGSNGDPVMQLLCHYAKHVASQWGTPLVMETCYPALGIELVGNMFRLHAMYMTDKVSSQPLTPMLHLSDMRFAVPGYVEMVARTLQAAMLLLTDLREYIMQPPQVPVLHTSGNQVRNPEVIAGIPHPLRNRFTSVTRLSKTHVYLCKDSKGTAIIAKLVPGAYPTELHRELERSDLVPTLRDVKAVPGGFTLVETDYMDPQDGWRMMDSYTGDMDALEGACQRALTRLAGCLGGKAVHGDLRVPNIFVRVDADGNVAVRFIDLDWSGAQGLAQYPPFINQCIPADVGPITQQHDQHMLAAALEQVRASRQRAS